ncbi:diacylglycerol acyltransferase [Trypanosoma grayi]|uniref:diacylglycerol acyltransferase n=1 Tax=Trypanosoma grayi TaxID=71804 RepID=UPI0004F423CB|nr:diacylglycerol acyltransferase [Trypanosoma grayi]KEG13274.1 diacylglycerol acyltransferase [Trypanosoma grayi]
MQSGSGEVVCDDQPESQSAASSQCAAPEYVASPTTVADMHEQLDLILGACAHLQELMHSRLPVTQREVSKLRKAFWLATGRMDMLDSRSGSVCSSEDGRGAGSVASTDTEDFTCARPDWQGARVPRHRKNASARKYSIEKTPARSVSADNVAAQVPRTPVGGGGQPDAKTAACDRALRQLEEYVKARPEAQTHDLGDTSDGSRSNDGEKRKVSRWGFFSIPLERRLQTLVVSLFLFYTFIPTSLVLTVMFLLNWWTMPLMVVYLVYIFTLGRPRHPLKKSSLFARLKLWRYYSDYFPVRLVIPRYVRRQFDASKNYFFIYHPHGIHGFGAIAKFGLGANVDNLLPGIRVHTQTLKMNFFIPFWRELTILCGSGDASADCIRRTLRAGPGESVLLVVGGAQESLLAKPNTNELTLRARKGFVRIALQEGTPLVPVYAFGENDVYRIPRVAESEWWRRVEGRIRKYTTFAVPLFVGRGWFNYCFGVLPHRRPIVVVVGEPMPVPKIPDPTPQELQEWHDKYVAALHQLFNEHRGVYDVESSGLRIL